MYNMLTFEIECKCIVHVFFNFGDFNRLMFQYNLVEYNFLWTCCRYINFKWVFFRL